MRAPVQWRAADRQMRPDQENQRKNTAESAMTASAAQIIFIAGTMIGSALMSEWREHSNR